MRDSLNFTSVLLSGSKWIGRRMLYPSEYTCDYWCNFGLCFLCSYFENVIASEPMKCPLITMTVAVKIE